ncbi:MAG: lipoprotein insertase outer membrane protein LolB [Wenzhouxiangella sp.]
MTGRAAHGRLRLAGIVALCAVMAGCAVREPRPEGAWVEERQAFFEDRRQWSVSGRAALREGRRGGQLSFTWRADGDHHTVDLSTVTGGKRWRLEFEPGYAELEGSEVGHMVDARPEPLVEAAVGWPIPVSRLADWIRGLVSERGERVIYDRDGTVDRLIGEVWTLDYRRYADYDGVLMPVLLEAESDPYRVRLAMRDWNWPASDGEKSL